MLPFGVTEASQLLIIDRANKLVPWTPIDLNLVLTIDFPLDFLHTFTAISPLVTQTLDNSNFPLSGSNFCFPSDHYNSNHVFSVVQVGNILRQCTTVPNIELCIQFVCVFLSVQFKYSVQPCLLTYIPFFNVNISYCP